MGHANDKGPNFYGAGGRFFLVRCFVCGGDHGTENWAPAVATGCCAFCGWSPPAAPEDFEDAVRRKRDDQLRGAFGS